MTSYWNSARKQESKAARPDATTHTIRDRGAMHHVCLCFQTIETDLHFLDAIMRGLEVVAQCLMCTQYVVCKCTS